MGRRTLREEPGYRVAIVAKVVACAHLDRIVELYQAGAVRPPPVTLYSLADAAQALRISEARHLKGKLVLRVK